MAGTLGATSLVDENDARIDPHPRPHTHNKAHTHMATNAIIAKKATASNGRRRGRNTGVAGRTVATAAAGVIAHHPHKKTKVEPRAPPAAAPSPSPSSAATFAASPAPMHHIGRVDHYFSPTAQPTQHNNTTTAAACDPKRAAGGNAFLKELFSYPHSGCIAVQGGGTEGYIVNRAFMAEAQKQQAELVRMVETLKRENEELKGASGSEE